VPLGDFKVDLRVWGVQRLDKTSHTCKGSADDVDIGTVPRECGEECIRIDIIADCQEFQPSYHRQM
jgi:hypothetical protein